MNYSADIRKIERHFLPHDLVITDWNSIEPYFTDLINRNIDSKKNLEQFLRDISELEAVVSEDFSWRQIRMTCDTENKQFEESFNKFVLEIQPKIQPVADQLNKKIIESPSLKELESEKYFTYLRNIRKNIELYRDENVPLLAETGVLAQQFGIISGKMTVEVNGTEYTLQQAAKFLEHHDRHLREEVYRKINERRMQDKEALNDLFSKLLERRDQIAKNAGFENFRDFKFVEMGRFDYTKEDTFQFHKAVKLHVLPLVNKIYERKRKKLGVETLRPWDIEAQPAGVQPLNPFKTGNELLEKSIACFNALDPFFAACLRKMKEISHLDLESRKGKAPGGYNCPLAESGAPFIFMNAAGQMDDVTTMLHEGGHAIHSFLAHELELSAFKEYPMEIAEVASMTMELLTMDHWDVFFSDKDEMHRAKEHQLERVITIFPWIATIDKFQHWVYENPTHSLDERKTKWTEILNEFTSTSIDVSGLEHYRNYSWQRQLHLYEVPFYYIEYGIAQLGAIGLWMQFRKDRDKALQNYTNALSLGGTKTLPQLYEAAGLKFDLSPAYINELMQFVNAELDKLAEHKN